MRVGVRGKLVIGGLAILIVVSFGFTLLQLELSRAGFEEDLRARAVFFAREIAATISEPSELEPGPRLDRLVRQIKSVRPSILQLEILAFAGDDARVVATSHPTTPLPLSASESEHVRTGQVVSKLLVENRRRVMEVVAPVTLDGAVPGAVATKFSLQRGDALAERAKNWALTLTAASVVLMGLLMAVGAHVVVNRPIRRFMEAIRAVQRGDESAAVRVTSHDEFGLLATHFNEMMTRLRGFNAELQVRVKEATRELEARYEQVQGLQQALFQAQRNLCHAERLALSGRIMAEVAHEVGTPLHSVAGHLELLRQDLPGDALGDSVTRRLAIIETELTRVTQIITQLLDLTRRDHGEPVAVDLNHLVRDTADLVRPGLATAQLALHLEPADALPAARGHANQLQQVVLNLLTNAMDATPPGGVIRVITRPLGLGEQVELEVSDSGRGIPAHQLKQIFEPFFSTKEPGRGTGLGLFISAEIVREHKGRIDVTSDEDRGTTFRVRLPTVTA
jgi:signal transduction histidine kinase